MVRRSLFVLTVSCMVFFKFISVVKVISRLRIETKMHAVTLLKHSKEPNRLHVFLENFHLIKLGVFLFLALYNDN